MAAPFNPGIRAELDVTAGSVGILGLVPDCPKGSLSQQVPVYPCNTAVPVGRQWGRDLLSDFSAACQLGRNSETEECACTFLAFISGTCCLRSQAAECAAGCGCACASAQLSAMGRGLYRSRACGYN